jgi:ABC-2 type transport system permease protein
MKAMIACDFACLRTALKSVLLSSVFVALVVLIGMGSFYILPACLSAMIFLTLINNLFAYDELNGWQGLRLTMPITRKQTVEGRYASALMLVLYGTVVGIAITVVLIGVAMIAESIPASSGFAAGLLANGAWQGIALSAFAGVSLSILIAAVMLPVVLRNGLTKGTRVLPVAFALVVVMLLALGQGVMQMPQPEGLVAWLQTDTGAILLILVVLVVSILLLVLSCLVSIRLYAKREL